MERYCFRNKKAVKTPGRHDYVVGQGEAEKSSTVKILSGIFTPDNKECPVKGRNLWKERISHGGEMRLCPDAGAAAAGYSDHNSYKFLKIIDSIPKENNNRNGAARKLFGKAAGNPGLLAIAYVPLVSYAPWEKVHDKQGRYSYNRCISAEKACIIGNQIGIHSRGTP